MGLFLHAIAVADAPHSSADRTVPAQPRSAIFAQACSGSDALASLIGLPKSGWLIHRFQHAVTGVQGGKVAR